MSNNRRHTQSHRTQTEATSKILPTQVSQTMPRTVNDRSVVAVKQDTTVEHRGSAKRGPLIGRARYLAVTKKVLHQDTAQSSPQGHGLACHRQGEGPPGSQQSFLQTSPLRRGAGQRSVSKVPMGNGLSIVVKTASRTHRIDFCFGENSLLALGTGTPDLWPGLRHQVSAGALSVSPGQSGGTAGCMQRVIQRGIPGARCRV